MSHDRGCYMCSKDPWEYGGCRESGCPKSGAVTGLPSWQTQFGLVYAERNFDLGRAEMHAIDRGHPFVESWNAMASWVHATAKEKGFWDKDRNDAEAIALMHSELSECLEGIRKPGMDDHCPTFSKVEVELADVIIRIMDFAEGKGHNVAAALIAKSAFNRTRPHKHGKAF